MGGGVDPSDIVEFTINVWTAASRQVTIKTDNRQCATNHDLYVLLDANKCFFERNEINVLFDRILMRNIHDNDELIRLSKEEEKELHVDVLITFGSLSHCRLKDFDRLQRERYEELTRQKINK